MGAIKIANGEIKIFFISGGLVFFIFFIFFSPISDFNSTITGRPYCPMLYNSILTAGSPYLRTNRITNGEIKKIISERVCVCVFSKSIAEVSDVCNSFS